MFCVARKTFSKNSEKWGKFDKVLFFISTFMIKVGLLHQNEAYNQGCFLISKYWSTELQKHV